MHVVSVMLGAFDPYQSQYAIGRFKQPLGLVGPRWREQVIERLNSALLQWIESLPPHRKFPDA